MRIFKWSTTFHVDKEPSVAPVWFQLPKLLIHHFNKEVLFQIVSPLGIPLFVDAATSTATRPSYARVCVEVDLLKPRPSRIWISNGDQDGFWQSFIWQNCSHCFKQGHGLEGCHVLRPELRVGKMESVNPAKLLLQNQDAQQRGGRAVNQDVAGRQNAHSLAAALVVVEQEGQDVGAEAQTTSSCAKEEDMAEISNEGRKTAHEQTNGPAEVQRTKEIMVEDESKSRIGEAAKSAIVADRVVVLEHGAYVGLQTSTSNPLDDGEFTDLEPKDDHSIQPANGIFTEAASKKEAMEANDSSQQGNVITSDMANVTLAKVDQIHNPRDVVSFGITPLVGTSTRTQTKSSMPRFKDVPQCKDVFEELKWERLHNSIPLVHQKSFLHSSTTCNDDKNEEEEDDSQCKKDKDQYQNLVHKQFIQVISKKVRKQLSKRGKTRQDVKPNSHAHLQSHKCGLPSCG